MLSEYLEKNHSEQICWVDENMPGVRVCRFVFGDASSESMRTVPAAGEPFHFETFFCQGGRMTAELNHGCSRTAQAQSVFLLSDTSEMRCLKISGDLKGILVSVDAVKARDSFFSVCSAMGLRLDTGRVKKQMDAQQGCCVLWNTPWTRAMFECLNSLPEDTHGRYCVFKALELLYLLCVKTPAMERDVHLPSDGYISKSVLDAKAYMQAHLSEKITIPVLSRRFSVSPTLLKTEFRRAFGVPIHSWLVEQRMKRAQDLICSNDLLSIQTIAQSVGYDSVSQFNAAFKRYYGTTPGRFRKMSKAANLRLFW